MATVQIPTITITTPSGITGAEAIRIFTDAFSYQATLGDGSSNPETRAAYAKRMIARFVADTIRAQRISEKNAVPLIGEITAE